MHATTLKIHADMNTVFRLILPVLLLAWPGGSLELKAQGKETGIMQHINTYLSTHYSGQDLRLHPELKWAPPSIKNNSAAEVVSVKYSGRNKVPRGYEAFEVTVKDSLAGSRTDRVQVYVAVERFLPVASRRIQRGDSISEENAHMAWVDVTRPVRDLITSIESVEGQVAAAVINAGDLFTAHNIRSTPVVFAGEAVNLLYNPGGIQVQLSCIARQDGGIGDEIRLYSQETGKTYLGQVVNKSTVKWKSTL